MKLSVYIEDVGQLSTALGSRCDGIRFGSEFCEWKLPSLEALERVFRATVECGKSFTYVTPRLSEAKLREVELHLAKLNQWLDSRNKVRVVANDLGIVALLRSNTFPNLCVQWGRQLTSIPDRARPSFGAMLSREGKLASVVGRKVFESTDLNYLPTRRLLHGLNVTGIDIDWVPTCFPALKSAISQGLELAVHTHLVLVTLTRKCHTARFLGEQTPDGCTRPCYNRVFCLQQPALGRLYLMGNVVMDKIEPSPQDFRILRKIGATELVVFANSPVVHGNDLDNLLDSYGKWMVPRGLSGLSFRLVSGVKRLFARTLS